MECCLVPYVVSQFLLLRTRHLDQHPWLGVNPRWDGGWLAPSCARVAIIMYMYGYGWLRQEPWQTDGRTVSALGGDPTGPGTASAKYGVLRITCTRASRKSRWRGY